MAKTPAKAAATPTAADVLLGSDGLPSIMTYPSGETVFPGDVVRRAFEASMLTADEWNSLDEERRGNLLAPFIPPLVSLPPAIAEPASSQELIATELKRVFTEPEETALSNFKVSRPVLIVSAPGGARRRAGLGFDVQPRELTEEELGATAEEVEARINALRADPKLKIDTRLVEIEG